MNDLIPIAIFVLCLLTTFGLVRVCEWLRPAAGAPAGAAGGTHASAIPPSATGRRGEGEASR